MPNIHEYFNGPMEIHFANGDVREVEISHPTYKSDGTIHYLWTENKGCYNFAWILYIRKVDRDGR